MGPPMGPPMGHQMGPPMGPPMGHQMGPQMGGSSLKKKFRFSNEDSKDASNSNSKNESFFFANKQAN
jgi:hypothetical protein